MGVLADQVAVLETKVATLESQMAAVQGQVANLENIHGKGGWHDQQVRKGIHRRPSDLLVYYGWPSGFNSAVNQWNLDKVAQDMAKYGLVVLGAGLEDSGHGDHSNTVQVITKVKALNPTALIFGYVSTNQDLSVFQSKANLWNDMGVHGIFMDESGYDYGKTRGDFNDRVDHVHGLSSAKIAFANAWNTDHVLGTADDPSFPNSTFNASSTESLLGPQDWVMLESFGVNTSSYGNLIEPKAQWAARGCKMLGLRATYNVNFAGVGVIQNGHASASSLFAFGVTSALMWSLEAFGTSDASYASGSAAVDFHARPAVAEINPVWSLNPSVQADATNGDRYFRYVEKGRMMVNFADGSSEIVCW